jgi:hypothetical protein
MVKYTILILVLLIASLESFAQFTGGDADGYTDASLTQSTCPPLVSDFVFYGGDGDGHSDASLTQSTCPPLISNFAFYGGDADGSSDASLTQSTCPPLVSNFAFYGGDADGHSEASLTQSTCPPLVSNFVFYGGDADGHSDASLTQSTCPPLVSNFVFYGGDADGHSDASLTQSTCPPLVSNFVFYGGNADGHSEASLTQSTCPPLVSDFVFYGGNADGFSYFVLEQTLCPSLTPLPVELLSFTAERNDLAVDVKWQTASEINNDYFTVERSRDVMNFTTLVIVKGSGNSTSLKKYTARDDSPYPGTSYYRLKQTDFDGGFKYSKVVAVNFRKDEMLSGLKIYPNPVTSALSIEMLDNKEPVNFEIINATGSIVYKGSVNQKTSVQVAGFPSGTYVIKIATKNGYEFRKFVKL